MEDFKEILINPKAEALSLENIRNFEEYKDVSDEVAGKVIHSIHVLCDIVYEFLMQQPTENTTQEFNNPQKLAA